MTDTKTEAKPPRAGKRWTPEEDTQLEELLNERESWTNISSSLQRTEMAVKYRVMAKFLSANPDESLETISEMINIPVAELTQFKEKIASREPRPPRSGKRWTAEEDAQLEDLITARKTWTEIGDIHQRPVRALKSRAMNKALTSRYVDGDSLEVISEALSIPLTELNQFLEKMAIRKPRQPRQKKEPKPKKVKEPKPEKPKRLTIASLAQEVGDLKRFKDELLIVLEEMRLEISKLKASSSVQ